LTIIFRNPRTFENKQRNLRILGILLVPFLDQILHFANAGNFKNPKLQNKNCILKNQQFRSPSPNGKKRQIKQDYAKICYFSKMTLIFLVS
jgi:hypothetical protein